MEVSGLCKKGWSRPGEDPSAAQGCADETKDVDCEVGYQESEPTKTAKESDDLCEICPAHDFKFAFQSKTTSKSSSSFCHSEVGRMTTIKTMQSMYLSRPDLLRAIRAAVPLYGFGKALRSSQEIYEQSFVTGHIDEFWSHSWHAKAWHKILMLMLLQNGTPAVATGMCGALLAALLTSLELLPSFSEAVYGGRLYRYSCWSLLAGTLCSMAGFFLWRSRQRVFLDRACINQRNASVKAEGIAHLGAFLKNSAAMVVLWDPSYVQRMWCVFEVAAFIKSHGDESHRKLKFRPVILAPCTIISYVVFCINYTILLNWPSDAESTSGIARLAMMPVVITAVASFAIHAFRKHHRDLYRMKAQVKSFTVKEAKCSCCSMNHIDITTGDSMSCDRKAIEEVIKSWFGSIEKFEAHVRDKLHANIEDQLGCFGMPFPLMLIALCPGIWGEMDMVSARFRAGDVENALARLLYALGWCFGAYPLLFGMLLFLGKALRKKQATRFLDVLATAAGATCFLVVFCFLWALWIACSHVFAGNETAGGASFLLFTMIAPTLNILGKRFACVQRKGSK